MTPKGFEEREKGMEARFRIDADERFRIEMRRNKLIAKWAAQQMGLTGGDAEEYVRQVVQSDFQEAGDADVRRKLLHDLRGKDIDVTEDQVRAEMKRCLEQARREIHGSDA